MAEEFAMVVIRSTPPLFSVNLSFGSQSKKIEFLGSAQRRL